VRFSLYHLCLSSLNLCQYRLCPTLLLDALQGNR